MRPWVMSLAIATVLLGGCGGSSAKPVMMRGKIIADSDHCGPLSTASMENVQIQVLNESKAIIATGTTGTDLLVGFKGESSIPGVGIEGVSEPCLIPFTIKEVPGAKFYTLKVNGQESPAWSLAELKKNHFEPQMEVGNAVIPTSSRKDFCYQLQRLYDSLNDPHSIQKDSGDVWDGWLTTAQEVGFDFQRSRVLAGRVDATDPEMYNFAKSLEGMKVSSWVTVKDLNQAAAKVNPLAEALVTKYGCDVPWLDVSYSPGK